MLSQTINKTNLCKVYVAHTSDELGSWNAKLFKITGQMHTRVYVPEWDQVDGFYFLQELDQNCWSNSFSHDYPVNIYISF